eukprot:jgi/Botrbrau1/17818/Bobra.0127s0063.1
MGERIAFEDLTTELANVRTKVERWAYNKMAEADDSASSYQRKMIDQKARVQQLEVSHKQLQLQADALQKRRKEERDEEEALLSELGKLRLLEETMPRQINDLQEHLEAQTEARRREEQELSKKAAKQEQTLQAMQRIETDYSSRTGLRFQYCEDGGQDLRLLFTHIDPENPSREFGFSVRIGSDSQFLVSDCSPSVEDMPALVAELNVSRTSGGKDNFGKFVRKVRAEFRALVLNKE